MRNVKSTMVEIHKEREGPSEQRGAQLSGGKQVPAVRGSNLQHGHARESRNRGRVLREGTKGWHGASLHPAWNADRRALEASGWLNRGAHSENPEAIGSGR